MIEHLEHELYDHLANADRVWIASALICNSPLHVLLKNTNSKAQKWFLVGINLPTEPEALKHLASIESKGCSSKVYYNKHSHFHPKVYIVESKNGLVAFVGSANLTYPGFNNNVEMSVKVTGEEAKNILTWFEQLFSGRHAHTLNDRFLKKYRIAHRKRKDPENDSDQAIDELIGKEDLNAADLKGQFFSLAHHLALAEDRWKDYTGPANQQRIAVQKRLLELHEMIFPQFPAHGLLEVDKHDDARFITSRPNYVKHFSNPEQRSIWLHYGKPLKERATYTDKRRSFLNHIRMQVIVHSNDIGIWLVLGKDGTQNPDKDKFGIGLQQANFMETFYRLLTGLPAEYRLRIGGRKAYAKAFHSAADLTDFCRGSDLTDYFIIERQFLPADPAMSANTIATTVLTEFRNLYPLYVFLKS